MRETKLIAGAFGFMFVITFSNTAWPAQEADPVSRFTWKDGAEIYNKICAYCHEAHVGPQIRNRKLPVGYIRTVVRNGYRAMPAFRSSEIDDESLVKLADFISEQEGKP